MKKVYVAEGALNLALACSAGTGDAEKAEPVVTSANEIAGADVDPEHESVWQAMLAAAPKIGGV